MDQEPSTLLDAWMRQRGWGPRRFAAEYAARARQIGRAGASVSERQVRRWRDRQFQGMPHDESRMVLEALCGLPAARLLGPASAGNEQGTGGDATDRRDALRAITGTSAAAVFGAAGLLGVPEALEYTRRAARSDVGDAVIEQLDAALDGLGRRYATIPAGQIWPIVAAYRQTIADLLAERITLSQATALTVLAGRASTILAWLAHDLGENTAADVWSIDALEHGRQAGSGEVCAWALDVRCTTALYGHRYPAALDAAIQGAAWAPPGTPAAVRLSAQLARAQARCGNPAEYATAMRAAEQHLRGAAAHAAGLFSADQVRLRSYAASSQLWLNRPELAAAEATEAISLYAATPQISPARYAIAVLDLATALAFMGQLDGALEHARTALATDRFADAVHSRAEELHQVLRRLHPRQSQTVEIGDRLAALHTASRPVLEN